MRIAFFSETFLPVHDGVGHVVDDLGRALIALGHEVTLFTTRAPGQPASSTQPGGMRVVRLRSFPVPFYGQYRWALFPHGHVLRREFGRNFDLVHLHTPFGMGSAGFFAARRFGLPVVGTFHTDLRAMQGSFADNFLTRLFFPLGGFFSEGIYWRCDATTAPTPEAKRTLEGRFTKKRGREVLVVPNGVDTERFRPGLTAPDWGARLHAEGRPLVTFLGRLTSDKGVHRFLDAVAGLPVDLPFLAVLGGAGVEERAISERIEKEPGLRGRAVAVGAVLDEEKPALLSQSRVFVLPSVADTSSVSSLEAMASGCGCVITDRGGPRELVRPGENALLVDPTDPSAIRGAVEKLLRDPALVASLGRGGAEYVQATASVARMAEAFQEIYRQCLAGHPPGSAPQTTRGPHEQGTAPT